MWNYVLAVRYKGISQVHISSPSQNLNQTQTEIKIFFKFHTNSIIMMDNWALCFKPKKYNIIFLRTYFLLLRPPWRFTYFYFANLDFAWYLSPPFLACHPSAKIILYLYLSHTRARTHTHAHAHAHAHTHTRIIARMIYIFTTASYAF